MKVDKSVNWYIDYNYEHFDAQTGKMVGTLRIPCFLIHNEIFVDSPSILQNSLDYVGSTNAGNVQKTSADSRS